MKLWDIETEEVICGLYIHEEESVNCAAFSPDGRTFIFGGYSKPIELYDIEINKKYSFRSETNDVQAVVFSPDGLTAITADIDFIKLWDVLNRKEIRIFEGHNAKYFRSVAFSPDGKTVLAGNRDNTLKLLDVGTGQVTKIFKGDTDGVKSVAFSPDGKKALSGNRDGILKLWDVSTGKEIISMAAFADGEWAAVSFDGYFDHSKNGRKHIGFLTGPMALADKKDPMYEKFYKPNGLLNKQF
jgi:WD40 repeat protein